MDDTSIVEAMSNTELVVVIIAVSAITAGIYYIGQTIVKIWGYEPF